MPRKPRMTKTEKAFMEALHPIIWTKGVENLGQSKTFKALPEGVRNAYISLIIHKTR